MDVTMASTDQYTRMRNQVLGEVGGVDQAVDTLISRFIQFVETQGADSLQAMTRPSGVILNGIPGSGKTRLALSFVKSTGMPFDIVNCPDLFLADQGKSESQLLKHFSDSGLGGSCRVLVFEDIDVLSGSKLPDSIESRVFSLLLDCIDSSKNVFVVGTTSRIETIPEEIRRPGRLSAIVDVHLADAAARAAVLRIMLKTFAKITAPEDIDRIAKAAHGFSAADLQSLRLNAFMEYKGSCSADDMVRMTANIKPSNLSSFQSKIPPVRFSDIFGLDDTISRIRSLVIEPLLHVEKYHAMQVEPPRGALIYGPPGSGKSMMCCAVANELAINTIWVDSTQMRSMVVGESEKAIAELFAQARKSTPCILVFDHIDALAPRRGTSQTSENTSDRIVTSLLVEMDGFNAHADRRPFSPGIFVLAVTSRPHVVDPALLRPGRLDVCVGLEAPGDKERKDILEGYMDKSLAFAKMRTNTTFVGGLVDRTRGYTGADLANLCREAAMTALRRDISSETVTEANFLRCLEPGLR